MEGLTLRVKDRVIWCVLSVGPHSLFRVQVVIVVVNFAGISTVISFLVFAKISHK